MAKKKVVRRRGKSKAKNKGYFRKEHQEAIVQFCKSDCPQEKDRLYTDIIREALEKLSILMRLDHESFWDSMIDKRQSLSTNQSRYLRNESYASNL